MKIQVLSCERLEIKAIKIKANFPFHQGIEVAYVTGAFRVCCQQVSNSSNRFAKLGWFVVKGTLAPVQQGTPQRSLSSQVYPSC